MHLEASFSIRASIVAGQRATPATTHASIFPAWRRVGAAAAARKLQGGDGVARGALWEQNGETRLSQTAFFQAFCSCCVSSGAP